MICEKWVKKWSKNVVIHILLYMQEITSTLDKDLEPTKHGNNQRQFLSIDSAFVYL